MPNWTQNVFYGGEISETAHGRVEIQKFSQSLAELLNMVCHTHGSLSNRPGMEFIVPPVTDSGNVRIEPFVYNVDDTYTMVITALAIRFIRNDVANNLIGYVLEPAATITDISSDVVTTNPAHGYAIGDFVSWTDLSGVQFYYFVATASFTTTTFTLEDRDGSAITLVDDATSPVEVVKRAVTVTTPYTDADLDSLDLKQKSDTIRITHRDHHPRDMTRSSHTSWTLTEIPLEPDMPKPTGLKITTSSHSDAYFYNFNSILDVFSVITDVTATNPATITIQQRTLAGTGKELHASTPISKGTTCTVTTANAHGYVTGDIITFADIVGMTELEAKRYTITVTTTTAFTLDGVNSTLYDTHVPGGTQNTFSSKGIPILTRAEDNLYENRIICLSGLAFTGTEASDMAGLFNGLNFKIKNRVELSVDKTQYELYYIGGIAVNGIKTITGYTEDSGQYGVKLLNYLVTAVSEDGEESFPTKGIDPVATDSLGDDRWGTILWAAPAGANTKVYNVYKEDNTLYGFIGQHDPLKSSSLYFNDNNILPELADNPPEEPIRNPFQTPISYDGISADNPVQITAVNHNRIVGDRVVIDPGDHGFLPAGIYYVRGVIDDDTFSIEDVDRDPINGSLSGTKPHIFSTIDVHLNDPITIEGDPAPAQDPFVVGQTIIGADHGGTTQLDGETYTVEAVVLDIGDDSGWQLGLPTSSALGVDGGTGYSAYTSGGTFRAVVNANTAFISDYPACSSYFKQRSGFASKFNARQTVDWSATGLHSTFSSSSDAFSYKVEDADSNEIRHMLAGSDMLLFTSGSVILSSSGGEGFSIANVDNIEQMAAGIAKAVPPLKMRNSVIYVQDKHSKVYDLAYTFEQNKYLGEDLTILVPHLIENETIVSWGYQKVPEPIVWAIMSNGSKIGMTYERDNNIFGWHKHDTPGLFGEYVDMCITPEGADEVDYYVTRREVNGITRLFIERSWNRKFNSVRDCKFVDAFKSLDNPIVITAIAEEAGASDAIKVTAAGHSLIDNDLVEIDETLGSVELNLNVYRAAQMSGADFYLVDRFISDATFMTSITIVNTTEVLITHDETIEFTEGDAVLFADTGVTEMDGLWFYVSRISDTTFKLMTFGNVLYNGSGWANIPFTQPAIRTGNMKRGTITDKALVTAYRKKGVMRELVSSVTGLNHLEGEDVEGLVDGNYVSGLTVASGAVTLPDPGARVHLGLGYVSRVKGLPLDTPQSELSGRVRSIMEMILKLYRTRGLKAGPATDALVDIKERTDEDWDETTDLLTGEMNVDVDPYETNRGQYVLQQDEALPCTIQAVGLNFTAGGE